MTGINISHNDGAFYATPGTTVAEGLVNGMVEASAWATKTLGSNIAWTEVTEGYVRGHLVADDTQRVVVYPVNVPMDVEDELTEWIFDAA